MIEKRVKVVRIVYQKKLEKGDVCERRLQMSTAYAYQGERRKSLAIALSCSLKVLEHLKGV